MVVRENVGFAPLRSDGLGPYANHAREIRKANFDTQIGQEDMVVAQ